MKTVSIHPSQLVIGALQTLGRAGIDATLTPENVAPAVNAATDLLRALGVQAGNVPVATRVPAVVARYRLGTPEMWARDDAREALARRDIGVLYRILGRHGISQRAIAAATGQSQSEISEIIAGRQVISYNLLIRIADGLGVPREQMGLGRSDVTSHGTGAPHRAALRLVPDAS